MELLVVILVFIFIGFIIAIAGCITWMQRVVQKYYQLRELRLLTGEYIVQDLSKLALPTSPLMSPPGNASWVPQASAPPQQESMDSSLPDWGSLTWQPGADQAHQGASAPSAPPANPDWAVVPTTSSTVQQSLTMDLQAIYGYEVGSF